MTRPTWPPNHGLTPEGRSLRQGGNRALGGIDKETIHDLPTSAAHSEGSSAGML